MVSLLIFSPAVLKFAWSVFLEGSYRPDSKAAELSSTGGHDTGSLAMRRRTCSLGCAMGGKNYENAGHASDTNSSDVLYTCKSQNILITEKCNCCLPTYYLGIIQDHEKIRPSKPLSTTKTSLGFNPRHCKYPWVELFLTHHQWSRHHGHQHAEAKTERI